MTEKLPSDLIGELLSLLAHDLRNPLSALHSNVGFVGSMTDPENVDTQEAIADALLSCDSLGHIIDSIEILSHVLTGHEEQAVADFEVSALVQDAVKSCAALATSHEVSLAIEDSVDATACRATANREMAGRALICLVRNAIQHAPPGSTACLSISLADDRCLVFVRDGGPALAEEATEAAFTAAGQISTKGIRGGRYSRGLGLYCARVCAQAAQAEVLVHREATTGNAFKLVLRRTPH